MPRVAPHWAPRNGAKCPVLPIFIYIYIYIYIYIRCFVVSGPLSQSKVKPISCPYILTPKTEQGSRPSATAPMNIWARCWHVLVWRWRSKYLQNPLYREPVKFKMEWSALTLYCLWFFVVATHIACCIGSLGDPYNSVCCVANLPCIDFLRLGLQFGSQQ